jgi:excisionase family DNA binding protein
MARRGERNGVSVPPLVDADAIADDLHVNPETVRKWVREGRIPSYRAGRYLRFDPVEVRGALRASTDHRRKYVALTPDFDAVDRA